MERLRKIGSSIQKEAMAHSLSPKMLAKEIGCSETQVLSLFKGRAICSFDQLQRLATLFSVPMGDLLEGTDDYARYYENSVVSCMNHFNKPENREKILDIIYDYLDICDLTAQ